MTFVPQNMASRLTSDHFDSDFCVPWSFCNQTLPDKLSWYEFDVFTGRSIRQPVTVCFGYHTVFSTVHSTIML